MTTQQDPIVWWLTFWDCRRVDEDLSDEAIPQYIQKEFDSRVGRAGRGRLWAAPQFKDVSCDWDMEKPACKHIVERDAGGIILNRSDAANLPDIGFFTDLNCKIITP